MGASDHPKAVEVLDLLLKFFGNGSPGQPLPRRCTRFRQKPSWGEGDAAERYLEDEISPASACNEASGDCARFRASLRRASGGSLLIQAISILASEEKPSPQ
jgi:hypothetical protein